MAKRNYTVLLGARDEKKGKESAAKLVSEGLDVHFLHIEPTNAASVQRAKIEVESKYGVLDVLINNAGVFKSEDMGPGADVPTQVIRDTYETNVFGLHEGTTRECLKRTWISYAP